MKAIEKITDDAKALIFIVLICLIVFLPICILTPCYYADDGGYFQMLSYFVRSGKVDLMHWSQPTAIGMLLAAAPITKLTGLGFTQVDCIGLSFSIVAIVGVYKLVKVYTSSTLAFLLAISVFCFNEITFVTPTFMTDMPFLAYFIWCLVFTDRILVAKQTNVRNYLTWTALLLLLALLTRSTGFLVLPGLIIAAYLYRPERKQLSVVAVLFSICVLAALIIAQLLSVNKQEIVDTTALREILQLHDFARFNLRAMALAVLSVIFSLTPLLVAIKAPDNHFRITQGCSAVMGFAVAAYFAQKGLLLPLGFAGSPVVVLCVTLGAWNLPIAVVAAARRSKVFSVVLISFIVLQFTILPIMAHPLVRHAIPGMVASIVLIAIANSWRPGAAKLIGGLSMVLAFCNVISLQQMRLETFAELELAQALVRDGEATNNIDAGWAWFCYQGLRPGSDDPSPYTAKYNNWRSHAKFYIGSRDNEPKKGRTLVRLPVHYFAHDSELVVTEIDSPQ